MLAETLLTTAQPNSYPSQREFNPFALPVYVRSASSSLVYPVADGYQFSRPIVAPEPQAAPTVSNTTSIDFEASGLYAVAQHENQSTFKLISALTVMAHQQGKTIGGQAITVRASLTELVVETRMAKPGVNRAIKEAIAKGYIAQTLQGNAIDGKSCYQLNLPFVVPTVSGDGHAAWSQISTHPQSSGYEQRTLDLTAETRFEATNAKNGWSQISTHAVAAPIDTNVQGQTYAQVRDSNRISTLNINNSTINSRNNRNTESRTGESERIQAYAQPSAPVSTPITATHAQSQVQAIAPVSARARNSRSRTNVPDTRPLQLTLNLNLTGFTGQPQTIAAAPGITLTIQQEQVQPQPITDHIGDFNEMVATTAIANTTISRGPSVSNAPDSTAVQASEPTEAGDYSYNLPVIENTTQLVQTVAATVSASDNVVAASESPKHVTSYEQLAKEPWQPRLKPKVECPATVIDKINRFSTELGNDKGKTSNATQVANIFGEAGIATDEFLVVMNKSRKLTETFAKARPGDKSGQKRNLMPYFFKVLRDQLGKYLDGKFDYDDDEDSGGSAAYSTTVGVNQPTLFATETNQDESAVTDVEVEFEEVTNDGATTEVKPVSAAMVSAISSRDKEAGANIDVFGSWIEGDVLFAKFYRQAGSGDTSRWVSWLKPYGISRVEVI